MLQIDDKRTVYASEGIFIQKLRGESLQGILDQVGFTYSVNTGIIAICL